MPFKVIVTSDFDHMSEVAARIVVDNARKTLAEKGTYILGLATGNTPTGLYKHFAKAANGGEFDPSSIESFNLDEYIGLPGENAQQRALHRESYSFFMIQELFGLMSRKFREVNVPWGTLIDQEKLDSELKAYPDDWVEHGADRGKAIVIDPDARSEYLRWIRREILDAYGEKIRRKGGIDLHIIGVGGKGHVAFHESGIPFERNEMLLVKLDDNTVENAVADGHFPNAADSPWYAISMGAELVYQARTVVLLANGGRKAESVAASLLNDPSSLIPISYGQILSRNGGMMIYVIDKAAGEYVLDNADEIRKRGIEIEDMSNQEASQRVSDLQFYRDPETCLIG
ncbi:MAG: 6-phosphogluconolactonase [Deltaproteobacteria bacterium]|nr:6-phosphogluconolactonase [Deltaproteobacteria bacterium]MBN2688975.1 6-phosphogluconolactonase [Deltaproteobacteria bacterium]